MKRKVLALLLVAAAGILWSPVVRAQCGSSLPFGHFGGSYLMCTDTKPVDVVVTAIGSSATTGTANAICEASNEAGVQGGSCQLASGSVGDNQVTVSGNFAAPGSLGCPNSGGLPGVGRNVYAIRASDGSGLFLTTGYFVDLGLYSVDHAHKALDNGDGTFSPIPLACQPAGFDEATGFATGGHTLSLDALTPGPPPVATVTLRHPTVFSDCDPDSLGVARNTGSCDPGSDLGATLESSGNIYVTTARCEGTVPSRLLCDGGARAGLPCAVALDCGTAAVACRPRWEPATTVDPLPLTLPATTDVTLPTSACVGGSVPESPCTASSECFGRCTGGSRDGFHCTTAAINGPCQGQCTVGQNTGNQCTGNTLTTGCAGRCTAGTPIGGPCTASTQCGAGGICTAWAGCTAWPCTLGSCQPLTGFSNQCVYLADTFSYGGTENSSVMSTPIQVAGSPGAPSERAFEVRAEASTGNVKVHFRTASELQLRELNVLTETKAKGAFKVASVPLRGVGGGGATYDVAIGRGNFQGGKLVIIESVLSDGTRLRSEAAQF